MSFFNLLQEKKRQLQPLSSHHLLLSCGAEVWWWSIFGIKQQSKDNKASALTFIHVFIHLVKACFAQANEGRRKQDMCKMVELKEEEQMERAAPAIQQHRNEQNCSQTRKGSLKCIPKQDIRSIFHSSLDTCLIASSYVSKGSKSQLTWLWGGEQERGRPSVSSDLITFCWFLWFL